VALPEISTQGEPIPRFLFRPLEGWLEESERTPSDTTSILVAEPDMERAMCALSRRAPTRGALALVAIGGVLTAKREEGAIGVWLVGRKEHTKPGTIIAACTTIIRRKQWTVIGEPQLGTTCPAPILVLCKDWLELDGGIFIIVLPPSDQ